MAYTLACMQVTGHAWIQILESKSRGQTLSKEKERERERWRCKSSTKERSIPLAGHLAWLRKLHLGTELEPKERLIRSL
jgi:hypothetical protein